MGVEAARTIAKALEGKNLLQVQICVWFVFVFSIFLCNVWIHRCSQIGLQKMKTATKVTVVSFYN